MLKNIKEMNRRHTTIEFALESPDVCMLNYNEKDQEYYAEFVEDSNAANNELQL
jgi:hypothetical protein